MAEPVRSFSPAREPAGVLARRTVGRDAVLRSVVDKLRSLATSAARPHVLLLGPSGSGRTHLIEVALHLAGEVPGFAAATVVVRIGQDDIGVTRFVDVLSRVRAEVDPSPGPGSADAYELQSEIRQRLGQRAVVLVIEDLDRVFADIGLAGQRALRAWVETTGSVMLLASATWLFPGVADRDRPWFGGLATILLGDLDAGAARPLVAGIAVGRGAQSLADFVDSPAGLARLRALAALAGGSPRIWTLLGTLATRDCLDALVPALLDIIEVLVPAHQCLLAALSANERRLVSSMAGAAGALTVAELSRTTGIEQRTTASALGRMSTARLVTATKPTRGDRRSTYYRIRDPLLGLHLQYRTGRGVPLEMLAEVLRDHHDRIEADAVVAGSAQAIAHLRDWAERRWSEHDLPAARELRADLLRALGGQESARFALPAAWLGLLDEPLGD